MSAEISLSEVKKHKNSKSLWMVIHNQVYDVTKFLQEHPGGEDSLLEYAGKDGTQAFEDVGHSEDAREIMKKYKIGVLPAAEKRKDVAMNCNPSLDESKPWRTFDGAPASDQKKLKSSLKNPASPKPARRVETIVVPQESSEKVVDPSAVSSVAEVTPSARGDGGGYLKWALLALAGAIIVGVALKKYMG